MEKVLAKLQELKTTKTADYHRAIKNRDKNYAHAAMLTYSVAILLIESTLAEKLDASRANLNASCVSGSMADKAQMINALTNTMAVNKNELGGYHNLRDNSLEKLQKLIESIDI